MDEKHREVLQQCSEFLIKNVRPEPLIDWLYAHFILTADDQQRLRRQEATTYDKNRLLVDILPRAGPDAFSSLVKALTETEQPHVANHLLAELEKGMSI